MGRIDDLLKSERKVKSTGKGLDVLALDAMFDEMEDIAKPRAQRLREEKDSETFTEEFPTGFKPYSDIWRYEPVDTRYFFSHFLKEPFTPKQQEAADIVCGVDPYEFTDLRYNLAILMWGKGSGKDSTVAKCFIYQGYKLCCLTNPQHFLGLGIGSPIDMVNVASNATQAKNIFFKYLSNYLKAIRDPDTDMPWFSTRNFYFDPGSRRFKYMDLRESEGDIKKSQIEFHRGITCHSLTSDKFTAEGLTLVLAVMDEIGAMRADNVFGAAASGKSDSKMLGQYDSLGSSVRRSSKYGKMMAISYKYGASCPMSMLVRKEETNQRAFVRRYSVYEVRTDKKESDLRMQFKEDYDKDPEKAAMIYECKNPIYETNSFISNPFVIENCIDAANKYSINPVKGKRHSIDDISVGIDEILEPWFKGDAQYYYAVHLDLAKGQIWNGGDACGIVMAHLQPMRVNYDRAWVEFYKKTYGVDLSEYNGELRLGIVQDLVLQVIARKELKEVRIADMRKFVIDLQEKRGFGILKVTLDRWGSQESIQEFNRSGIDSVEFSVDRSKTPYITMKDYMQQCLFRTYANPIWKRECKELIDIGTKIDHPDISPARYEIEGVESGSKDLTDGSAATTQTLVTELVESGDIFFA